MILTMLPVINLGIIQVPSFFLIFSLLMGVTFYLSLVRSRNLKLDKNFTLDLALVLIVSAIIGSRMTHVIFENWDYYRADPVRIFYFWEGGFVFYGGFLLSFFSGLVFLKIRGRLSDAQIFMRVFTPILSFVYATGRIGCFLEGCCYGKTCSLPWAIAGRHPTQLYSSLWEIGVLIFILNFEVRNPKLMINRPEHLFLLWIILHSIGRGAIEFLRDDYRGDTPLFSLSTWISFVLFSISVAVLLSKRNTRMKDGQ